MSHRDLSADDVAAVNERIQMFLSAECDVGIRTNLEKTAEELDVDNRFSWVRD